MFMALAKPLNTSKKHGRVLPPGARRPQLSKAEPASLLSPSSPSLGPLLPLFPLVVPFLLPMWTVCASDCLESDHFQAGRREQTPSEEVIYPTKREACQLLASPLIPSAPPAWSGLLVAIPLLTLHCVSCGAGSRTLMCNISLLYGW